MSILTLHDVPSRAKRRAIIVMTFLPLLVANLILAAIVGLGIVAASAWHLAKSAAHFWRTDAERPGAALLPRLYTEDELDAMLTEHRTELATSMAASLDSLEGSVRSWKSDGQARSISILVDVADLRRLAGVPA